MKLVYLLGLLVVFTSVGMAKGNAKVASVIESSFVEVDDIEAKSLILSSSEYAKVKRLAKASVPTKVYRYYDILSKGKSIGKGVLISRKVRTKKATVLYVFDSKGRLRFSEIMAFAEPPEFIPSKQWMTQLQNQSPTAPLQVGKDIPTISGATLSARTITEGARVAKAIYHTVLRK